MFYCSLIKCNRPIWIVSSYWSRNIKSIWQFHINSHILAYIQLFCKFLLVSRIIDDVIIQMFICFHCIHTKATFNRRICKYFRTISIIRHIISNMFNNCCGLFIINQRCGFNNKFFWIILKLIEYRRLNSLQNTYNCFSSQIGFIY